MPYALLILLAVIALLIASALLAVLFALLIRLNPAAFGGPVAWTHAALISLAIVGVIWLLILTDLLSLVLLALVLGA